MPLLINTVKKCTIFMKAKKLNIYCNKIDIEFLHVVKFQNDFEWHGLYQIYFTIF